MVKVLPPQAYTWAVLKEAYNWLQSQPASIRELAQSADDAVSLYKQHLRSQKQNNSESFKAELKNLSQGLKKFDSGGEEKPSLANSLSLPTTPLPPSTPTTDSSLSPNSLSSISLDEKTQISLHIARERLNLGSSQEALRVLVALGIEKLKDVLPKT